MPKAPDFAALVNLFPVLKNLVDACGEVILTSEEAAHICLLGFRAHEGRWKVPPVPPELVRDNPLLEHLSIGWDTRQSPDQTNSANQDSQGSGLAVPPKPEQTSDTRPEQAGSEDGGQAALQVDFTELHKKIIRAIEEAGGCIQKRRLQQKFWRYSAKDFKSALQCLCSFRFALVQNKWVVALHEPVTPTLRQFFARLGGGF